MEQEKYIELIVDSYDGNLSAEDGRILREALEADPSLREMYRLYGESLSYRVPPEEVDTAGLRERIVAAIAFRRRAPLRRIVTALSAAAVIAAVALTLTLPQRGADMRVAMMPEVADTPSGHAVRHDEDMTTACGVHDRMPAEELPDTAEPVTQPAGGDGIIVGGMAGKVSGESVELREEFFLATPLHMIEVEHDPASMLCGLSVVPEINAGYTILSTTSSGFADRLSDLIRIFK